MCTWLSSWNRTIHTYLFDLVHIRDITMSGLGGLCCQNGGLREKCPGFSGHSLPGRAHCWPCLPPGPAPSALL